MPQGSPRNPQTVALLELLGVPYNLDADAPLLGGTDPPAAGSASDVSMCTDSIGKAVSFSHRICVHLLGMSCSLDAIAVVPGGIASRKVFMFTRW